MVPVTSVPVPAAQPVDGNVVIVHGTVGGEQHVLPPYGGGGGGGGEGGGEGGVGAGGAYVEYRVAFGAAPILAWHMVE